MPGFERGDVVRLRDGVQGPQSTDVDERRAVVVSALPDGALMLSFEKAGAEVYLPEELILEAKSALVDDPFDHPGQDFGGNTAS